MESADNILCETQENIFLITLNRPSKKNALTKEMYRELEQALETAEQQSQIKAVVLTGHETCFCAGQDLHDFQNVKQPSDLEHIFKFLERLAHFQKPLIAAVNGAAIGIGTTMLLHCDMVYAAPQSVFQLPFIHLGVCPEAGSSLLLPALCGKQKASELFMFGEKFDAETAYEIGFVNLIVSHQPVLNFALDKASQLANQSATALMATKRLLKSTTQSQLDNSLALESQLFFECLQSPECQTAIQAFFKTSS